MTNGSEGMVDRSPASAADRALFVIALLAGAAIRILPAWSIVFPGPGALLLATDPWYHLRRIRHAVAHFPAILDFDPFVNFPEGARIIWPPGFDLLLSSIARLLSLPATPESIERVSALAIPLLGVATIAAAWAFGRASLTRPGAGVTALGMALLPYPVGYGLLGYVDHHVMEPLFLCASGALALAAFGSNALRAGVLGAAAGLVASASCWFVPDGAAIVTLVCALATLEGACGRLPGARTGGISVVIAAALGITVLSEATPWGRSGEYTYLALSPFHAHLAWAGAGISLALITAADRSSKGLRRFGPGMLGLLVACAALASGGAKLLDPVREAFAFLSRTEGFASTVGESMPLWNKRPAYLAIRLSPLGLATPFVLIWAAIRDRERAAGGAALLGLAAFGMGLVQMRFMVMGSLGIAWATGWILAEAWGAIRSTRRPILWRTAAVTAVCACLVLPHALRPTSVARMAPDADQLALAEALRARTGDLNRGTDGAPAWSVIAPWPLGHLLLYRAGVPVVACPFGQAPWHERGLRRASLFDLAASDEVAASMAARLRVRYVVTTDPFSQVIGDARIAGLPPERYVRRHAGSQEGADAMAPFQETAGFRLHLLDGSAAGSRWAGVSGMPSFRLVWETAGLVEREIVLDVPAGDRRPSKYKIFEVVKSARIEGRCEPGEAVSIRVRARTNLRAFQWWDETRCGAEGRYALRTPNPSTDARVSQGGRGVNLVVSEEQVRRGDVIRADLEARRASARAGAP